METAQSSKKPTIVNSFSVEFLGQAGFRVSSGSRVVYVDPYLSDSVRQLDAPDLVRQVPLPYAPEQVTDADWVLITHAHIDHCDPHTIPGLAQASPAARFMGPPPVLERLHAWGISSARTQPATESWCSLWEDLRIAAVPAAHPVIERDAAGRSACVGYVLEGPVCQRAYFAGDTAVAEELLAALKAKGKIHTALLPVNEHNFFRARRGIIGNMTVREAFLFAEEIGAARMFPYHWDMFAANGVEPEEIELLYAKLQPRFRLLTSPFSLFVEGEPC